jgi:hypothetical protein
MSSVHDGFGSAPQNAVPTLATTPVTETPGGPTAVAVHNVGDNPVVVQVRRTSDDTLVALEEDTAVASEDTAYDGDTSTLAFSGENLNSLPIVPGSVEIVPTAGGDSVDAKDTNGDGILFTDDVDADECGTIDYLTGALVLNYPAGKAPNTTNILANYTQGVQVVAGGKRMLNVQNFSPQTFEGLEVRAAGLGGTSKVRLEAFQTF